jgi:hypothetical protein
MMPSQLKAAARWKPSRQKNPTSRSSSAISVAEVALFCVECATRSRFRHHFWRRAIPFQPKKFGIPQIGGPALANVSGAMKVGKMPKFKKPKMPKPPGAPGAQPFGSLAPGSPIPDPSQMPTAPPLPDDGEMMP